MSVIGRHLGRARLGRNPVGISPHPSRPDTQLRRPGPGRSRHRPAVAKPPAPIVVAGDGAPTAEACRAFGCELDSYAQGDRRGYMMAPPPPPKGRGQEIAFLRVRWKAPGGGTSQLMERPIGPADRRSLDRAPEATRLALAVAAYDQKLRGDPWLGEAMDWTAIERMASGAEGDDALRAEFADLVGRAARSGSVAGGR